jgi:hypothetical protein
MPDSGGTQSGELSSQVHKQNGKAFDCHRDCGEIYQPPCCMLSGAIAPGDATSHASGPASRNGRPGPVPRQMGPPREPPAGSERDGQWVSPNLKPGTTVGASQLNAQAFANYARVDATRPISGSGFQSRSVAPPSSDPPTRPCPDPCTTCIPKGMRHETAHPPIFPATRLSIRG